MDLPLLNRKQLAGLIQLKVDTESIVRDLASVDVNEFTSINLSKSNSFDNYPLSHRHCYDTFFKGTDEGSLASERYVQYSFTEQFPEKTVDATELEKSGATVKSRLRRLQQDSPNYIPEADDLRYTELIEECPLSVKQLVETIRSTGDVVTRVRLAGIAPGHSILLHRDHDPTKLVRIHIPIITNDKCVLECENKSNEIINTHLALGNAYVLNTGRRHAVKNDSDTWRVHLLIDIHGQNFLRFSQTDVIIN